MSIHKIACVGGYNHKKTNVQLQFCTQMNGYVGIRAVY